MVHGPTSGPSLAEVSMENNELLSLVLLRDLDLGKEKMRSWTRAERVIYKMKASNLLTGSLECQAGCVLRLSLTCEPQSECSFCMETVQFVRCMFGSLV